MASSQELLLGTGTAVNQYQIQRSLRFNSADSAYLNRTPASAGNRKTWTVSLWFKRSSIGPRGFILGNSDAAGANGVYVEFPNGEYLRVGEYGTSSFTWILNSTPVYRDPSAWYHLVISVDTNQATAANRVKVYINNVQITAWATESYPSQNSDTYWNNNQAASIGRPGAYVGLYFDGYITNVDNIDGQQLTPSSFGETNADTGVWQPKAYSGTYGTNGFQLLFADNSGTTSTTLGKDTSGNGNNWTPNNFSVTAGVGNDSLVDTPTPYGTDTGVGGEVRGNYSTINPLYGTNGVITFSNGNLECDFSGAGTAYSSMSVTSGKWYWEYKIKNSTTNMYAGVINSEYISAGTGWTSQARNYVYDGNKYNGANTSYGSSFTVGDTIGLAIDMDNGKIWFSKNGTWQASGDPAAGTNAAFTDLSGKEWRANFYAASGGYEANFGQRPFAYTAPSGFKALCTQNLPTPTIGATSATQAGKYFNPVLYTGDGANPRTITGVGFQPDLVWVKRRNGVSNNFLQDAVRGVTSTDSRSLVSNATDAETNYYTVNGGVTAFTSDGFTTSGGTTNNNLNNSGNTMVAWNWKANGAGSTNTSGTITSTVSANTTAGFSIVRFTGSSSASPATVGHGLGAVPQFIITKPASEAGIGWFSYHASLGRDYYFLLDNTVGASNYANYWGSSAFTSSVFGVLAGGSAGNNRSGQTMICYCFAPVAGYSAFGSYTGNGSTDGPFIYTGFRPAWVLIKGSSLTTDWWLYDVKRQTYNVMDTVLYPNLSSAEASGSSVNLDILSNGFKSRSSNNVVNGSGQTYIYAAFAENPFKYSLAR